MGIFSGRSEAALGGPWEWTVNVIPGQVFDNREQALAALNGMGGKYAHAKVVENTTFTDSGGVQRAIYTYGAFPRDPNYSDWYDYGIQWNDSNPHSTELAATSAVEAYVNANTECGFISLVPNMPWYNWRIWYNGEPYEQSRFWSLTYGSSISEPGDCAGESELDIQGWRKRDIACPEFFTWITANQACELHNIATITGVPRSGLGGFGGPGFSGPGFSSPGFSAPGSSAGASAGSPAGGAAGAGSPDGGSSGGGGGGDGGSCASGASDLVQNPCSTSTGNKSLDEVDIELPWISLRRSYQSQIEVQYGAFGKNWTHSHNVRMDRGTSAIRAIITATGHPLLVKSNVEVVDGSGERIGNHSSGKQWLRADGSVWTFNILGRLIKQEQPNGHWYTYSYDSFGRLTTITHASGRALTFEYEPGPASAASHVIEVKFNGQVLVSYDYDTDGNLVEVQYADGSFRTYQYEDTAFPNHLTGITDENDDRFATYAYDEYGRAIMSTHAGGAGRVDLVFEADGSTVDRRPGQDKDL